jgi:hypothetical protein
VFEVILMHGRIEIRPVRKFKKQSVSGLEMVSVIARVNVIMIVFDSWGEIKLVLNKRAIAPITPHPLRMNQWYKHSGKIPLQTEVMLWVKDLATRRNQNSIY